VRATDRLRWRERTRRRFVISRSPVPSWPSAPFLSITCATPYVASRRASNQMAITHLRSR